MNHPVREHHLLFTKWVISNIHVKTLCVSLVSGHTNNINPNFMLMHVHRMKKKKITEGLKKGKKCSCVYIFEVERHGVMESAIDGKVVYERTEEEKQPLLLHLCTLTVLCKFTAQSSVHTD